MLMVVHAFRKMIIDFPLGVWSKLSGRTNAWVPDFFDGSEAACMENPRASAL